MSSNNISRITGLSELKQLKKLSLVGNELTKIGGLDGLTSLETVQLQGNKLAQLDDAQKLAKLPCLRTLRLHDNPMCEHPAYWSAVRRMLPNLRSLDGEFSTQGADTSGVAQFSTSTLSQGGSFIVFSKPMLRTNHSVSGLYQSRWMAISACTATAPARNAIIVNSIASASCVASASLKGV